jgi:hypothetical protein
MGSASIPGTGISYRHHFGSGPAPNPSSHNPGLPAYPALPSNYPSSSPVAIAPIEEVHSASTELLTSATLKQVKELIQSAYHQHQEISRDLDSTLTEKSESQARFDSWDHGFLLKKLFKKAFEKRREQYETDTAKAAELEEQLKLSVISTQIDVEGEQAESYYRMRDEFAGVCECAAIWDVKTHQATDKFHERTVADMRIGRERVRFELGKCDLIDWDQKVPHLRNAKGGDLFLYPGFILYRAAREAFSLIEYQDLAGLAKDIRFHEEDGVPADAAVIGTTWAKANKDGSRDRRFANNYQIPVVRYGLLTLKSSGGLWEEFQFSRVDQMVKWLNAVNAFAASFAAVAN